LSKTTVSDSIKRTSELRESADHVQIKEKLSWSYNPLEYAWPVHREYLRRFGGESNRVVFLGMNPGPWGMGQTGVPFGDPYIVRDWMKMGDDFEIEQPDNMTEDRPVLGFQSDKKEGSGQRLFSYIRDQFGDLEKFFDNNFILNYCPLLMFTEEGNNLTPSDLLKDDRQRVYEVCDPYIWDMIGFYDPEVLVGIGKFATERLKDVFDGGDREIVRIPHPSPASPIATRDGGQYWIDLVTDRLRKVDVVPR